MRGGVRMKSVRGGECAASHTMLVVCEVCEGWRV